MTAIVLTPADAAVLRQLVNEWNSGRLSKFPRRTATTPHPGWEVAIGVVYGQDIAAGGSGEVLRWSVRDGEFAKVGGETDVLVTAHDWLGSGATVGTRVILLALHHAGGARWIFLQSDCPEVVTFSSGDLILSPSSAAAIPLTAAVVPNWLALNSGVITLSGSAVGQYVRFRGNVRVATSSPATEDNEALIALSDQSQSYVLLQPFLPESTGRASVALVSPTIGPIFAGQQFTLSAQHTYGTNELRGNVANSNHFLELELIPCVRGSNIQFGSAGPP